MKFQLCVSRNSGQKLYCRNVVLITPKHELPTNNDTIMTWLSYSELKPFYRYRYVVTEGWQVTMWLTIISLCITLPGSGKLPSSFCLLIIQSTALRIVSSSTYINSLAAWKDLATNAVSHMLPEGSLLPNALKEPSSLWYVNSLW